MRLHQLKVDYDAEQDRLLMMVATSEGVELRLALTRRFVKLLWPLMVKLAEEASPRIRTQANPEARKALLGLEHERDCLLLHRGRSLVAEIAHRLEQRRDQAKLVE